MRIYIIIRIQTLEDFFFSLNNEEPIQLVYKRYKNKQKINVNESYKKQIFDALKCSAIDLNKIKKLDYYKNELISIFNSYNICKMDSSHIYETKNKGKFNLWARLGYLNSNLDFNYRTGTIISGEATESIGNSTSFYVGLELEYLLPFNNNKWSILLSPSYQSYNQSKSFMRSQSLSTFNEDVDYTYLDILFGVRHYFFLNTKSRIFINGGYVFTLDLNDSMISEREINSTSSISLGIGYDFNNKFNAEVRYNTGRDLLNSFEFRTISTDFSYLGIILGYNFL